MLQHSKCLPAYRNSYRNLEWPELVLGLRQSDAGSSPLWDKPGLATVLVLGLILGLVLGLACS